MSNLVSENFARQLRRIREATGMSQNELAQQVSGVLGVPVYSTTITKLENHNREIKLDEAVAIAQVLETPLHMFISAFHSDLETQIGETRLAVTKAETELQNAELLVDAKRQHVRVLLDELAILLKVKVGPDQDPQVAL